MANTLYNVVVDGITEWIGAGSDHAGEVYRSYCATRAGDVELYRVENGRRTREAARMAVEQIIR